MPDLTPVRFLFWLSAAYVLGAATPLSLAGLVIMRVMWGDRIQWPTLPSGRALALAAVNRWRRWYRANWQGLGVRERPRVR